MTLVCVPIMVEQVGVALADSEDARAAGADLVEWRVDAFMNGDSGVTGRDAIDSVLRLVEKSPIPCIVTCRIKAEGGAYDGPDDDLVELLLAVLAADTPARYIDAELATLERPEIGQRVREAVDASETSLIVSMHDFDRRPSDLIRRISRMHLINEASVFKIAYRARSLRDNLELFDLLRESDRPMIALAMGEFGLPSRVLAPKFGGFLTFASLRDAEATAPGQPTVAELMDLYRFRSISPATRVYGVVGWPVAHSMSPTVHNAGFAAVGHDGVYLPMPIPPEYEHIKATLGAWIDHPSLDFAGCSATLPHKEHLVRFAMEQIAAGDDAWSIERLVTICGAANTLVIEHDDGRVTSARISNTDASAACDALAEQTGHLKNKRVVLIGAGGVARAVAAGLLARGAHVVIANRTAEKAERLAEDLRDAGSVVASPLETAFGETTDAVVNCTSVGMSGGPAPDETPVNLALVRNRSPHAVVFDSVYAPAITPLLRAAQDAGMPTVGGLSMFVRQAEAQFRGWTGGEGGEGREGAPDGLFLRLCRAALEERQ